MKSKSTAKSRTTRRPASRQSLSCKMPRPGQKCPLCHKGKLDYDGVLNLVCPQCGHAAISGGFT